MLRTLLLNRYTLTFGCIAVIAALWNLYVAFNNDGIISGHVVSPDNKPVEGATVTLFQKTLYIAEPRDKTMTDKNGASIKFVGAFRLVNTNDKGRGIITNRHIQPNPHLSCLKKNDTNLNYSTTS